MKFITCGSVDDGKSTLVGRILWDAGLVPEDRKEAVLRDSRARGGAGPDVSLLLDGLRDEREQGITIDVSWNYFRTPRRAFVVADCPGHVQYTRNMATGASQCALACILIDATRGPGDQTRRHAAICNVMGIRELVLVINKMDLVDWREDLFLGIQEELGTFLDRLDPGTTRTFFPVSALCGDNVVLPSDNPKGAWYTGVPLLEYLETVTPQHGARDMFRFPVQAAVRPDPSFRGWQGTIASGQVSAGDRVVAWPSGVQAGVSSLLGPDGPVHTAGTGEAIVMTLDTEIDVSRGDILSRKDDPPPVITDRIEADIVWLDLENPLSVGRKLEFRMMTTQTVAHLVRIFHRRDPSTLEQWPATSLEGNGIGHVEINLDRPVPVDVFGSSPDTGSFILVDRITNATVAAGTVLATGLRVVMAPEFSVTPRARALRMGQQPAVVWLTGLSGSGKSTLADATERILHAGGCHTMVLDGDSLRTGLCRDLGFHIDDRSENVRRVGEVARLMADAGLIVLVSLVSPSRQERDRIRALFKPGEFIEVHVSTPLEECERRDPKGLYRRAREGAIPRFTGISDPYEPPLNPELDIDTSLVSSVNEAAALVVNCIRGNRNNGNGTS